MQEILTQIKNANNLVEATNALGAFKAHTLQEQATALAGGDFHPIKCSVAVVKDFYKAYLDSFDYAALSELINIIVESQYSGAVSFFCAIQKDELKEAFNERLCELEPEQFVEIFQTHVRYYTPPEGAYLDVAVGGLLLQHIARDAHCRQIVINKIKAVGLAPDTMLCYYEVPKKLSEIAHDASPEYDALLMGDVAASGSGGGAAGDGV